MNDWEEFWERNMPSKFAGSDYLFAWKEAKEKLELFFLKEVVRLKEEVKVLLMKPLSDEREIDLVEQGKKQGQLSYVKKLAGVGENGK